MYDRLTILDELPLPLSFFFERAVDRVIKHRVAASSFDMRDIFGSIFAFAMSSEMSDTHIILSRSCQVMYL